MPREYARYMRTTHHDPDWHQLTTTQHDCYMALLSSDDLDWIGVAPYFPARFAGLAADLTERKVERAWDELAERGYLVIDKKMGEVMVRTFLRHDNVLAKPNIAKAAARAYERIKSPRVRDAVHRELVKLAGDHPDLNGWEPFAKLLPELFRELFPNKPSSLQSFNPRSGLSHRRAAGQSSIGKGLPPSRLRRSVAIDVSYRTFRRLGVWLEPER